MENRKQGGTIHGKRHLPAGRGGGLAGPSVFLAGLRHRPQRRRRGGRLLPGAGGGGPPGGQELHRRLRPLGPGPPESVPGPLYPAGQRGRGAHVAPHHPQLRGKGPLPLPPESFRPGKNMLANAMAHRYNRLRATRRAIPARKRYKENFFCEVELCPGRKTSASTWGRHPSWSM